MKPCLRCGELSGGSYCEVHAPVVRKEQSTSNKISRTTERGYGWRWQQLSKKARALQPWCSDCGAESDLQADHSPEAWERYRQRRSITLDLVDVVCGPCNRARGDARTPGGRRSPRRITDDRAQGTETITHNYAERRINMQKGGGG